MTNLNDRESVLNILDDRVASSKGESVVKILVDSEPFKMKYQECDL